MFRPSKRSRFVGTGGFGEAQLLPPSTTTTAMMMNNSIANSCCWLDASCLGPVPSPFHHQQQQQQEEQPFIHAVPLATAVTKDIFLERLQKEIIDRFVFSLSSSSSRSSGTCCSRLSPDESFADARHRHMLLKKRIVVGFNACTKALQSSCYYNTSKQQQQHNNGSSSTDCLMAQQTPSLVVVALDDSEMELKMSPTAAGAAMLLAHIPLLAHQAAVPLLILPGPNASQCLNRLLMRHHNNSANGGSSSSSSGSQQGTAKMDTTSSFDPNHRIPRVTVMAFLPRNTNEFTSPAGQVVHGAVDSLVDFFISKAAGTTTTTITKNATAAAASCFASGQQQQQQPCAVSNKMIY